MKSTGRWQIGTGLLCLVLTVFVLPTPLFDVVSGSAEGGGTVALFGLGLALLAAGLVLAAVGIRLRSHHLRTPRSYDTREPAASDADRPVNPYALPKSYGAIPPAG